MPEASLRSVNNLSKLTPPCSCQEIQSWGSAIAANRFAFSGSFSAIHLAFAAVNDATKIEPTAFAVSVSPPNSLFKSFAAFAERRSFQSSASLITSPFSSSAIKPCCWAATEIALTSDNPPAFSIA